MRRLTNEVRRYAWGSTTAIPRLLGLPPDGGPHAELWLGAHPGAPSMLVTDDGPVGFDTVISADPKGVLGERAVARFGERLPFLLKVLAAEAPLSLQVHPDAERARAGYAAEDAAGIPVDAPHRNYRDPHHKPELVLALEPFEALCGFRDPAEARADLAGLRGELAATLRADLSAGSPEQALRAAMTRLLALPRAHRTRLVGELVAELARRIPPPSGRSTRSGRGPDSGHGRRNGASARPDTYGGDTGHLSGGIMRSLGGAAAPSRSGAAGRVVSGGGGFDTRSMPERVGDTRPHPHPHAATVIELAHRYPGDPGAIAALLLNRITLRPGQALFLPAGNVHAYLRGTAVEVMASSDNVLRAGLTGKHVDPAELLDVVDFSVLPIPYAHGRDAGGRVEFRPEADDFALSVMGPGEMRTVLPGGVPWVFLALDGRAELRSGTAAPLVLSKGESAFATAAQGPITVTGNAHVVAATIGGH